MGRMRRSGILAALLAAALLTSCGPGSAGAELPEVPEPPEEVQETPPEVTETPPEETETPPEIPETPPEVPETPPETEEAPPETPEAPPEVPEAPPEITEAPPETPPEETDAAADGVDRPSTRGALSVVGAQLCGEDGQAVRLRGISTHGLAWFPQYVNGELFSELSASWGVNVVRLALYTAEYGGWCTGGDRESLKRLILDGVQYASDADMYVIVDWHILSDCDPNTHINEAEEFFRDITGELAGFDNVLYEICNEPNGGTDWERIKAYAGRVIPVIRENAPEAVVLVGTPNWCQRPDEPARDPITGFDNIMYTLHFYSGTHKQDLRDAMTRAVEGGTPIFVSEFGVTDASGNGAVDSAEADRWVKEMDRLGVSWVMWSLSNKDESSAVISASCTGTSGFGEGDLKESGLWLLRTLSGTPAPAPEEPETGAQPEPAPGTEPQPRPETQTGSAGTAEWELETVNSWESGADRFFQYTLTVTARDGPLDTWRVDLDLGEDFELQSSWNGVFTQDGQTLTVTPMDYNAKIAPGEPAADIGFIVKM